MLTAPALEQVRWKLYPSRPLAVQNSRPRNVCQATVRLYPELSAKALQYSQDKPLALWYALRAINGSGSGVLDYGTAVLTLSAYAYTPGTARRHLREGLGKFWTIENSEDGSSRIRLFSVLRICEHFKVTRVSWPVDLPADKFRGLRGRRAALYASWLSHREGPISREAITKITGIGRRRQQRYDHAAGIAKRPNFAFYEDPEGRLVPIMAEYEGKSRTWESPKQLPCTFETATTKAAQGMTRKVNAALRRCLVRADATTSIERVYFDTGGQAARSKQRAVISYVRAGRQPLARGTAWILV